MKKRMCDNCFQELEEEYFEYDGQEYCSKECLADAYLEYNKVTSKDD
jgi:hypothetical protein